MRFLLEMSLDVSEVYAFFILTYLSRMPLTKRRFEVLFKTKFL